MNEDYVSFEVAKLLKEKGFEWPCQSFYGIYGEGIEFYVTHGKYSFTGKNEALLAAPTLCIAQKWLRETTDIHIMIDICVRGYYAVLWKTNGTFIKTLVKKGPNDGSVWDSYEEALQAGILEALKFI